MHGRRVGLVRYRNFGPFAEAEFDFSQPGLTGIDGRITWKRGADSNGSGKSYLMDGISWCLWGTCLREDYRGDDVVRIGSSGGACVSAEIVGGPEVISITRYRQDAKYKNRVYVCVGGKDVTRGTDVETQLAINQLVMDAVAGRNSLFFAAREDVKSFFTAPEAQRKLILDQILGFSDYAEAEKIARRRASALATKLAPLRDRKQHLDGVLSSQLGMLEGMQAEDDVEGLIFRAKLASARKLRCEKAVERRRAAVAESNLDLKAEEDAASDSLKAYEQSRDAFLDARSTLDRAVRKTGSTAASAETIVSRTTVALQRHVAAAGKACTTCGQPLPKGKHAEVLKGLQQEVEQAEQAHATAKVEVANATSALASLVEPERPDFPGVDLARDCLALDAKRLEAIMLKLSEAAADSKQADALVERVTNQRTQLESKIAESRKAIETVETEIGETGKVLDRLQFWIEGFGNGGLRSFMLEAEIPEINLRATGYAQQLLGPGATVQLSATTQLKTSDAQREKLSVTAEIPGCSNTYSGASKGQKRRLDLSLLLAFRDLVAGRSSGAFRQFFADELFDGLDQTGTECVVELLRSIADERDCPVVLVTHNLRLKSAVDRVLLVSHEMKYLARLVTPSDKVAKPKPKKLKTG